MDEHEEFSHPTPEALPAPSHFGVYSTEPYPQGWILANLNRSVSLWCGQEKNESISL